MVRLATTLLLAAAALLTFAEQPFARAADDDYWNGYWSWYDREYVPYYSRQPGYTVRRYNPRVPSRGRDYDVGGRYRDPASVSGRVPFADRDPLIGGYRFNRSIFTDPGRYLFDQREQRNAPFRPRNLGRAYNYVH